MNAYQKEYLETWKVAFAQFLCWSEAQILDWAEPRLERMDPPGMIINEPPLFYVAREVAYSQPYYDELSQRERWDLIRTIQDVLAPGHIRNFPADFDFNKARRELEELLKSERSARRALSGQEKTFRQASEERYLRVWKEVLRHLLGWSDTRIAKRLVPLRQRFRRRFKEMIHQEPIFWIADLLLPPGLQKRVGRTEARNLKEKLIGAIENGNFMWSEDKNYDWQKARDRISALFARYK